MTGGLNEKAAYREGLPEVIRRKVIFFRRQLSVTGKYFGA
jgi:hypothetical protein